MGKLPNDDGVCEIFPHILHRLDDLVQLDNGNLEKIMLHIIFNGDVDANADYVDFEDDACEIALGNP